MLRSARFLCGCAVVVLTVLAGCASRAPVSRIQLPPRVDLSEWQTIGIVDFDAGSQTELGRQATREFVQMVQAAQPGTRILELGGARRVLSEVGHTALDFEAARALGDRYGVDALFLGSVELSSVKPRIELGGDLGSVRARADVTGTLATKLLETRAGAVVWSRSSSAQANVARLATSRTGLPSFGAKDPAEAHAVLVHEVVAGLSDDFYPSWQ